MSVHDGPGEGTWSVFAQKVVEERDRLRDAYDLSLQQRRRLVDRCEINALHLKVKSEHIVLLTERIGKLRGLLLDLSVHPLVDEYVQQRIRIFLEDK